MIQTYEDETAAAVEAAMRLATVTRQTLELFAMVHQIVEGECGPKVAARVSDKVEAVLAYVDDSGCSLRDRICAELDTVSTLIPINREEL